jgi:ABC-type antimicrobial peptide transport system ATPase subunit
MTPLLDVRGLQVEIATRRGTVRAVDDVSFTLERERRSASSASPAPARR